MALRKGYTLTELLVGVLIIGVMATLGAAQYQKAVEQQRKESAKAVVESIATANRARRLERKQVVTGTIDSNSALIAQGLSMPDAEQSPYIFEGADPASPNPCVIAKARRKTSGPRGTDAHPYNTWGYCATVDGRVGELDASGACSLNCDSLAMAPQGGGPPGGAGGCTPNGSCSAAPAGECMPGNPGVDNCGNQCFSPPGCCPAPPVCTPDHVPACGETVQTRNQCGTQTGCSPITGPPCCVPNGSCNASPACGQTASGVDNCGKPCTRTGGACCVEDGVCHAPHPACEQTTRGEYTCGGRCHREGRSCPREPPEPREPPDPPEPSRGREILGADKEGNMYAVDREGNVRFVENIGGSDRIYEYIDRNSNDSSREVR